MFQMHRLLKLLFSLIVAAFTPSAAQAQTQVNWLSNIRFRPNILINPDGTTNLISGNSANPMLTITQTGAGNALTLNGNLGMTGSLGMTGNIGITGNLAVGGTFSLSGAALTLAGNTTFTGAFNPTFAIPSSSTWTFPAAGTLIGSADTGTVTNTMLATPTTATWCAGNSCVPIIITPKIVGGISSALNGASPAVATITAINPPFTSTSDFSCTANEEGTGASTDVLVTHNVSGSSFTITATNGATATVHWVCVGF